MTIAEGVRRGTTEVYSLNLDDAQNLYVILAAGGGVVEVTQLVHDLLNANVNLQVGDMDVANINPVPVSDAGGTLTVDAPVAIPVPVRGYCDRFDVALSLDTNIYATGDLLADTQEVALVCVNSGPVVLYDIRVLDEDDQGAAMDILFLRSNTTLGTENLAYAPTDAMGREILKKVVIAASDFVDEGAFRVAYKSLVDGIGCVMKPTSGTSLWIAAVCRSGTPTYTATGVRVQFGVIQQG